MGVVLDLAHGSVPCFRSLIGISGGKSVQGALRGWLFASTHVTRRAKKAVYEAVMVSISL